MNILVTGSNGFIGKNLVAELKMKDSQTFLVLIETRLYIYWMNIAKKQTLFSFSWSEQTKRRC